jgi:hypothetical protein
MTRVGVKPEDAGVRGRLLRIFGLGFGLAVVLGGVIGSGIMRNPGVVAAGFPRPALVLLAWLTGGLVVAIDAMSRPAGPILWRRERSGVLAVSWWAGPTGCSWRSLQASSL